MKPTVLITLNLFLALGAFTPLRADLRAGAALTDVTPEIFPVLINGGMRSRSADGANTRIHARCICLHDGETELAIVVVDSCMMPRPLLDEAKALAHQRTGIRPDHILIAATHAHSVPACMGCLGTDADPNYVPFLTNKLAEAVAAAQANLEPAKIGVAVADAAEYTALRRWIRRPDRLAEDPFGNFTVRANMHAANNWDDVVGESGPEDPDLSVVSIQAKDGRPLAVLANFSMHYFGGVKPVDADYFGLFSEGLKDKLAPDASAGSAPFVGMMSHGCSGDIYRRDYRKPKGQRGEDTRIEDYANDLVDIAVKTIRKIDHRDNLSLAMAETRLHLNYRTPDVQHLEWARRVTDARDPEAPMTRPEVYAREAIILDERKSTDVVVQAVRIGEFALATTPNETYAITGLKIKAHSPLQPTIVFDLTNGGDGYIPPPEQHLLGGYNTWPARSAGLEVDAEPKIAEAAISLLEKVAGAPRRAHRLSRGPAVASILKTKPATYYRLDEFTGPRARDSSGNRNDAIYEPAVAYYLEGPHSGAFCQRGEKNRAAHFAGDRLRARLPGLGNTYSVSLWFWNGMPHDGRDVTGWLFSRDNDHSLGPHGDHLGIAGKGTPGHTGKLIFFHGPDETKSAAGKTIVERWRWHHLALVRDGKKVRVYLDGALDIETTARAGFPSTLDQLLVGGRSDSSNNFEGRLDEIAIYTRALSTGEIATLATP